MSITNKGNLVVVPCIDLFAMFQLWRIVNKLLNRSSIQFPLHNLCSICAWILSHEILIHKGTHCAAALVPHAIDNYDECSTSSSTNATSSTSGENSSNQSLSNQTSSNLSSINRLNLTLENFDQEDIVPENCPYVLTSPRSIEACKIVGIRVRNHTILGPKVLYNSSNFCPLPISIEVLFTSDNLFFRD